MIQKRTPSAENQGRNRRRTEKSAREGRDFKEEGGASSGRSAGVVRTRGEESATQLLISEG